jgi:hypothetical protein
VRSAIGNKTFKKSDDNQAARKANGTPKVAPHLPQASFAGVSVR